MKLRQISKEINSLNHKKNFSESDHRKMSNLISDRAKETSRLTGMKVNSISYEDFKAFRERRNKRAS